MSKVQLDAIRAAIVAARPDYEPTVEQSRQGFDKASAALPPAPDVSFREVALDFGEGLWSLAPGARESHVVLYLHGGAYVLGNIQGYRHVTGELSRSANASVFAVNYRLAPENPFPAAVEDGVAAYRHLLDQGFAPGRVAFAGDSAGGGLAAATLLAARDQGLPMPVAASLFSPWLDLTCSSASMQSRAEADVILSQEGLRKRVKSYLGDGSPENPLASPVFGDLAGLPPLLIQVGEGEVLLDEALAFADRAAHAKVRVQLDVWPDMPHVWHRFLPRLDEAGLAVAEAGAFLDRRFAEAG